MIGQTLKAAALALGLAMTAGAAQAAGGAVANTDHLPNDYPTAARADYVFGCMASNGQTREALERCSCSLDIVASIIPYEKYAEAETVMRMQQVGGEKTAIFKTAPMAKELVRDLKRAQAEAEIRCF